MSDLAITVVPRELYYHEVDYVRGLEQQHKEDIDRLEKAADALDKYKRVTDQAGAAIDRVSNALREILAISAYSEHASQAHKRIAQIVRAILNPPAEREPSNTTEA